MKKPKGIVALPTSQMYAICDLLKLPEEVQESKESMILALEQADWSGLKLAFKLGKMSEDIVAARLEALGRSK